MGGVSPPPISILVLLSKVKVVGVATCWLLRLHSFHHFFGFLNLLKLLKARPISLVDHLNDGTLGPFRSLDLKAFPGEVLLLSPEGPAFS
jgi:hypothetical protein